ncbi:hypothetical protein V6N12_053030 [Hibiscus sabdariffa]|uniref:Uncharacterized protein n=1 Tax=Hibiscus sabdariffa TaxID=183260 RepID=A0ABR1ZH22_9ROSI
MQAYVILKFPNISQVLLAKAISDHNAILLHSATQNWDPKPFKFFNYWLQEEGFDELMHMCSQNIAQMASLLSWANAIGCSMGSLPTEYLGLPLGLLSFGGRINLVKSVLSSLSIFFMSLFRMLVVVTKRITGIVANFQWSGTIDKMGSLGWLVASMPTCGKWWFGSHGLRFTE